MSGQHVHRIILVRHGQTDYNAARRIQGQIDIALNEVGLWQADQTAYALESEYVLPNAKRKQLIVASDLTRAYVTATAFARLVNSTVHPDPRLRERQYGEWEGLTSRQLQEQWPQDYANWITAVGGEEKHGAESKEAVGRRGMAAIEEWSQKAGEDTDLYMFSHGSWISQTIQTLMGLRTVHPEGTSFGSIRNAHWATFVPRLVGSDNYTWALLDYNRGPASATQVDWNNPELNS